MSVKLSRKLYRGGAPGHLLFHCPGCDSLHTVAVEQPNSLGARWSWNGDVERPTFAPSLLIRWTQWDPPAHTQDKVTRGEIVQREVHCCCHSFIRDGMIQFLNDCTHALAGQTVPLPDMPGWGAE